MGHSAHCYVACGVGRLDPAATRRFGITKFRGILATPILLGFVALAGTACSGQSHQVRPQSQATTVRTVPAQHTHPSSVLAGKVVPIRKSLGLLLMRGVSVGPIAATRDYLVWEATTGEEGGVDVLYDRNLRTGVIRKLALSPNSHYGLAIAGKRIFYATGVGAQSKLVAVGTDGRRRGTLSPSLIAPFDVRGKHIAWAELDGGHQRVVVRNLKTGSQRVVEDVGCPAGQCYRIDRVTLADKGVVFDLGAISQGYPSLIVRRAFGAPGPDHAKVPADQQPDLAESSAGPLYYWLMHGWMRWDFGQRRPHLTRLASTSPYPLDSEGGRLLLLAGGSCSQRVLVRLSSGRKIPLPAPARTPVSPRDFGRLCRNLTGYNWTGDRLLLAWSFVPRATEEAHSDVGQAGMVTVAQVPR